MIEEIYDKIGGAAAVGATVNKLYEKLIEDPAIGPYFQGVSMSNIKKHQRAFMTVALGGPDAFYGKDLVTAHAGLRLSNSDFDKVAGHLRDSLQELAVQKQNVDEIMVIVGGLRSEIVSDNLTPVG